MFQTHEQKFMYITAGVMALFLIIGGSIIIPRLYTIRTINKEITDMRAELEIKFERSQKIKQSGVKISEIKAFAEKLSDRFVKKGEELKFIVKLEDLADNHKIDQKFSLSPTSHVAAAALGLDALDLNISAQGKFASIMKYLDVLEKDTAPLKITSLTISPGRLSSSQIAGKQTAESEIAINIKAEVYVKK